MPRDLPLSNVYNLKNLSLEEFIKKISFYKKGVFRWLPAL